MPAAISPSGSARLNPATRPLLRVERRAAFEHVVHAPQRPHALREVRIEVAVEDRVADGLVLVAAPEYVWSSVYEPPGLIIWLSR